MERPVLRGDEIIEHISPNRKCAKFIAAKLWRFFAYEDPEPAWSKLWPIGFAQLDMRSEPLLKTSFASEAFYSGPSGTPWSISSPIHCSGPRTLGVSPPTGAPFHFRYRQLGQLPFLSALT